MRGSRTSETCFTHALDVDLRSSGIFLDVDEVHERCGALCHGNDAAPLALSRPGNLALGLYFGARRGETGGGTGDGAD